uniref:BirA family transcriptional regulator, biotin operon repressor / biotin-[acetyl-CoA-carboxylase] ligase n=1 Tax=uncultured delta proteobacterium TaxID=34034 RepID=H5SJD6_9DELT|nr:BirA family transcriptional regulator, biotin operon repressor / biotin-[acetyl-CoA-carboxylase] ligase [uncultured delta proteobacterium]
MTTPPDDLTETLSRRLDTRWAGRPLVLKTHTGSTNDDAHAAAMAGAPHGYTIVADAQSAGRGRHGRLWFSPPGENLYVSVVIRPRLRTTEAPLVTLAAGLAVADAIAPWISERRVTIKWPNDVRIDGRKVAGVLVEGNIRGEQLAFAVVGIGINVRGATLPDTLATTATTLRLASGMTVSRSAVLHTLLAALELRIDSLLTDGPEPTISAVSARCDTLGTRVRVDGIEGVAERITASGGLLLRRDDGTHTEVRAGEITTLM